MSKVTDISEARKFRERPHPRMGKEALVYKSVTPDYDLCRGKRGIVTLALRLTEGPHKGKWLFTLRFETERGHIIQGYLEEEIKFL